MTQAAKADIMQNWVLASGSCAIRHDFSHRERIDLANHAMEAFMEERILMPGISLYRIEANGAAHFRIAKEEVPDDGRLILGCMMGGTGTITMDGCDDQDWNEAGRFFALSPVARPVRYDVRTRRFWRVVGLRLEPEALAHLAQDSGVPARAKDVLEGRLTDLSAALPLNATMRRLMQSLLYPVYSGGMERLYLQSKALELLACQLDALDDIASAPGLPSAREMTKLREARDLLVADLRNPPSLDALAAAVNLTPKRLNAGFRAAFGTTVFNYLHEARMDAAKRMLDEGLAIPLKQLAWQLGYNQASNFINAFRRRFGRSPGAYRSDRDN